MAIRDLPNTDGLPACEVDTAEELTQRLVPGVYVRAPREVLAACGECRRGGRPASCRGRGLGQTPDQLDL